MTKVLSSVEDKSWTNKRKREEYQKVLCRYFHAAQKKSGNNSQKNGNDKSLAIAKVLKKSCSTRVSVLAMKIMQPSVSEAEAKKKDALANKKKHVKEAGVRKKLETKDAEAKKETEARAAEAEKKMKAREGGEQDENSLGEKATESQRGLGEKGEEGQRGRGEKEEGSVGEEGKESQRDDGLYKYVPQVSRIEKEPPSRSFESRGRAAPIAQTGSFRRRYGLQRSSSRQVCPAFCSPNVELRPNQFVFGPIVYR